MATNLVNELHIANPSIFRLPRNTRLLPRDHRSTYGTAAFLPLRCRVRSTAPGVAEERTEKFQLCVCSKTCDHYARHPGSRRLSFSCENSELAPALVFGCVQGRRLPLMARVRATTNSRLSVDDWVQAGFAILAEEGIKALTIHRLCRRLGVTKGGFYWHFTDIAGTAPRSCRRGASCACSCPPYRPPHRPSTRSSWPDWPTALRTPSDCAGFRPPHRRPHRVGGSPNCSCPFATAAYRPTFRPSSIPSAGWRMDARPARGRSASTRRTTGYCGPDDGIYPALALLPAGGDARARQR